MTRKQETYAQRFFRIFETFLVIVFYAAKASWFLSLQLKGEETLKCCCICRRPTRNFNIVTNDHGRTHKCDFSVFDWKYSFRANSVQKKSNCQFKLNLVSRLIRTCRIQLRCSRFLLWTGNIFFAQIWSNKSKLLVQPFHDGDRYLIKTSPLICGANQWTGFYMITASVMKGLIWNLVPRLIQICRIQWWYSLFQFYTENTFFGKRR